MIPSLIRFWNALSIRRCVILWVACVFASCAAAAAGWWWTEARHSEMIRQIQADDLRISDELGSRLQAFRLRIGSTPVSATDQLRPMTAELLKAIEADIELHRTDMARSYQHAQALHDSEARWRTALMGLITVLLGAGLTGLLLRVVRPLGELGQMAARFEAGDCSVRAPTARGGEIGALCGAFNGLADTVASARMEQQRKEEELESLALFPDDNPYPVMRSSKEGTVLYANKAAAQLLNVWKCAVGAAAPAALNTEVQKALMADASHECIIRCGNRVFSFVFMPIADRGFANLYGRDITARERMVEALLRSRDELEKRVQERTAELHAANQALQADILERGRVENTLRESETRFRSTFENAPIGMTIVSADGRILRANRAHCEFLGYSEQELAGMSILDVTYPEDREETSKVSRQMREGGARIDRHQKRYVRKNGELVWGEVSVSVIKDADGRLNYTVAQIVDITRRRQAEEALRRSESLLRVITDNAQDAIFLKDREGRMLFANPAALAIVGKSAQEVIGKTDEAFHPDPETARAIEEDDQRVMNSDRMETVEETIRGPNGPRTYLVKKAPYHDAAGNVIGIVGTSRDITEYKRAERELRESETRFRSTFENAPIGMTIVSADGRILQTNRAHCEFLGYSEQELAGMDILDFTYPEDREETTRVIRQMWEGGPRIERYRERYVRKSGEVVWGEVNVSIIIDAEGRLNYSIAQIVDITERRRAEEALSENEETIRALLNATTDKVFLLDTAGTILAVNEMSARGWGRSVQQLVGACAYDFMTPAIAESRRAHFARCAESGRPLHFEDEHRGIWYDTGVYPIRDSRGKVTRMATFARDITERKRVEKALLESEQRYRELFEASPTALIEEDWAFVREYAAQVRTYGASDVRAWFLSHPDEALLCFRRIQRLDVNKAALRLFKAGDKKELLANFGRLSCDETRDAAIRAVAALAAGNEFFEAETSILTLTGEKRNLLVSISAAPLAERSLPRYIVSLSRRHRPAQSATGGDRTAAGRAAPAHGVAGRDGAPRGGRRTRD